MTESSSTGSGPLDRVVSAARQIARLCRAVLGVPDYDRYLAHMRNHHAGEATLTRDEFVRRRQTDRYERPGSRCC